VTLLQCSLGRSLKTGLTVYLKLQVISFIKQIDILPIFYVYL